MWITSNKLNQKAAQVTDQKRPIIGHDNRADYWHVSLLTNHR